MPRTRIRGRLAAASTMVVVALGCSTSDSTYSPSPDSTIGSTITSTAAGASPRNLVVPLGSQVTFINNDSVAHEMYSDPHPEHTDCPEFDPVGRLAPGAIRQTKNLTITRV